MFRLPCKTLAGIAQAAQANNIPVIAIAGGIGDDVEPVYACGIRLSSLTPTLSPCRKPCVAARTACLSYRTGPASGYRGPAT